jgi:tRNA U34 5-carboxymethylaminomethyl modifying GTPase MnmE/TrmE
MTFIDFKKLLLDAEITLPKFANLIKVSEKNIQAYKKKNEIPNAIAVAAKCFAIMNMKDIDYKSHIKELNLKKKQKRVQDFLKRNQNLKKIPKKIKRNIDRRTYFSRSYILLYSTRFYCKKDI